MRMPNEYLLKSWNLFNKTIHSFKPESLATHLVGSLSLSLSQSIDE